jgi:hypothetical protein
MKQHPAIAGQDTVPDALAKRIFLIALVGVLAYVGVVIALMSSMD